MLSIKGIDHIVLRARCVEKMRDFYCDVLGCVVEREQPDFGLTQLRAGNQLIDLLSVKSDQPAGKNMEHFCLRITPFDYSTLQQYFEQQGVVTSRYGERYGAQGMVHSFYIKDPEGNEIELCGSK